jgi:hypothetical protein
MKKVFVLAFLLIGLNGFSQEHQGGRSHFKMKGMELSAEQQATLNSKRLALALDLSAQQQSQVKALQLKRAEDRIALMEEHQKNSEIDRTAITQEERFNRINSHLDRQLAYKSEMKKILSETQYEKWNQMMVHMRKSFREGRGHRKNHSKR